MDIGAKYRLRGYLLQLLARMPADESDGGRRWLDSDSLTAELRAARRNVVREEVEAELAYLKGRGYVDVERPTGTANKILGGAAMARLTDKGTDIVDGTITDRAVDLGA